MITNDVSVRDSISWSGAINPRSLASLIVGRSIDWTPVKDPDAYTAEILGISKAALFDPTSGAPHFALVDISRRRKDIRLSREQFDSALMEPVQAREMLSSLGMITPGASDHTVIVLTRLAVARLYRPVFDPSIYTWLDLGTFFREAAEGEDARQQALGDCYFIAALSAVAWAYPGAFFHRTRRTGHRQQEFVDVVSFYGEAERLVETTELVPVDVVTGDPVFATSMEAAEIWPAILEKAYAKWRTSDNDDEPDYYAIEGGWPERACVELVPRHRAERIVHANSPADDIWKFLCAHVRNRKTIRPVVAATYGDDKKYTDENRIVGRHAYAIFGTEQIDDRRYVILRNPWGHTEAMIDIIPGIWSCWDASYLRGIPLNERGVFALGLETFRTHFQYTGVAVPQ